MSSGDIPSLSLFGSGEVEEDAKDSRVRSWSHKRESECITEVTHVTQTRVTTMRGREPPAKTEGAEVSVEGKVLPVLPVPCKELHERKNNSGVPVKQKDSRKRVMMSEIGDHVEDVMELTLSPESTTKSGFPTQQDLGYAGDGFQPDPKALILKGLYCSNYTFRDTLSESKDGRPVYYGLDGDDGIVAIKMSQTDPDRLLQRQKLKHPNVVRLYYWKRVDASLFVTVTEVCLGSLANLRGRMMPRLFEEAWCHRFAEQIHAGLVYLHNFGIFHGNLKFETLLLSHAYSVKIAGFSRDYSAIPPTSIWVQTMLTGEEARKNETEPTEFDYQSPELGNSSLEPLVNGKSLAINPAKVDVYRFGVILYVMLYGKCPYSTGSLEQCSPSSLIRTKMSKFPLPPSDFPESALSSSGFSLIRNMLNPNPYDRFSLNQIRFSHWFTTSMEPQTLLNITGLSSNVVPRIEKSEGGNTLSVSFSSYNNWSVGEVEMVEQGDKSSRITPQPSLSDSSIGGLRTERGDVQGNGLRFYDHASSSTPV